MLKWLDQAMVHKAAKTWVCALGRAHAEVQRIGYFGSYARGDWGVGSDLDVIIIMERSEVPYWQRSKMYDASNLPVPAELLVYTQHEWASLAEQRTRFYRTLISEAIWLYEKENNDLQNSLDRS